MFLLFQNKQLNRKHNWWTLNVEKTVFLFRKNTTPGTIYTLITTWHTQSGCTFRHYKWCHFQLGNTELL